MWNDAISQNLAKIKNGRHITLLVNAEAYKLVLGMAIN